MVLGQNHSEEMFPDPRSLDPKPTVELPQWREAGEQLLPSHWPLVDLDVGVSLQLDERLNNGVYRGFWVDFAAADLMCALRMLKDHPSEPLIYYGCLPPEYAAFDSTLVCEATWAIGRRGRLSAIKDRRATSSLVYERTGMQPVITLRNRYLGGWSFRLQLTVCGSSPDDLVTAWTETARKSRQLLRQL
jgi:hypothetical protein